MIINPATISSSEGYKILIGSIVPRPIAFVSTTSPEGVHNLAPFSFFNGVCSEPLVVAFSPGIRNPPKDTYRNIQATGEFVINIVNEAIAQQMNLCAGEYPYGVDEFQVSQLTAAPCKIVKAPRVLESPVSMECKLMRIIEVSPKPGGAHLILGEVVQFHIDDAIIDARHRIDPGKLNAIGRLGGPTYCTTRDRFNMIRP